MLRAGSKLAFRRVAGMSAISHFSKRAIVNSTGEVDAKLSNDVKYLGKTLGISIRDHDPEVFDTVEELRNLGREWRKPDGDTKAFEDMVAKVKTCDAQLLHGVCSSFTNFLALANTAENHHRIRKLRHSLNTSESEYGLWPKHDSCAGTIQYLIHEKDVSPESILKALKRQRVEIVLTAHPTEVNRRTMLRKLHNVEEILTQFDHPENSKYTKKQLDKKIKAEISAIWGSDYLRRSKPSPVMEARSGLAVVEHVLWNAIPSFLRKLDDVSRHELKEPLPLDIAPIKMASWMGGDRDGNPNVTPEVTWEVSLLSRWMAATLFKKDILELKSLLSIRDSSEELAAYARGQREPYRFVCKELEARLQASIDSIESRLFNPPKDTNAMLAGEKAAALEKGQLQDSKDLLEPLLMMHRSLVDTGHVSVADGELIDTIRRVSVFGMSLMPLDIRQESTRHTEALDAITQSRGLGSYAEWDESTRRSWLQKELETGASMGIDVDSHADSFSPTVVDTLRTFQLLAVMKKESLGAYVISQCQQASDVLAVMLLQQNAGVSPLLRVVPLFETLDDLERSADTMDALFSMSVYHRYIGGVQEIMVGYSDSAKDAGRLAASWAQHNAQVAMIEHAEKHNVEVTFFHGKGGTVGRGGNPALFEAILAHPPNTVHGRFRVTEQGEMITQNLGVEAIAERTLDLFTSGVLTEGFMERAPIKQEWKDTMERMSEVSCDAYRSVVRGEPRFVPYFRTATPELELAGLNVGSRPAKRNPKGGVESLRAIPWVFAWTQTRLNLPTWLGVGEALAKELETHPDTIKEMYREWPWFKTLIDLLEMIIVKSDTAVAANYDAQLVTDPESLLLGQELRAKLDQTAETLLAVSGNPHLQSNNPLLLRSLTVRNPYIDPLNIIQAELLARLRSDENYSEEERATMQDALLITINGIANGMRNSG